MHHYYLRPRFKMHVSLLLLVMPLLQSDEILPTSALLADQKTALFPFHFLWGSPNTTRGTDRPITFPTTTTTEAPTTTTTRRTTSPEPRYVFSENFGVNVSVPLQVAENRQHREGSLAQLKASIDVGTLANRTSATTVSGSPGSRERGSERLLVCLLIERNLYGNLYFDYDKAAAAIAVAVNWANDIVLPSNLQLETIYQDIGDSCGKTNHAAAHLLRVLDSGYPCNVIIGPGCGYAMESLHDIASFFRIPVIGCPAAEVGMNGPIQDYDVLSRISFTHINLVQTIMRFFRRQNYTNINFVVDESHSFYAELGAVMESVRRTTALDIWYNSRGVSFSHSDVTAAFLRKLLLDSVSYTRVIFLLADGTIIRELLMVAHELGMTNGSYVFVGVELFRNPQSWGSFIPEVDDPDFDVQRQAYGSLVLFALSSSAVTSEYDVFSRTVKELSTELFNYTYGDHEEVDVLTGHFFDAIIFYASVVRDLVARRRNLHDVTAFVNKTLNYTFYSPLNGDVSTDINGDRQCSYVLLNYDPGGAKFEEYLEFSSVDNHVKVLGQLVWPNGDRLPSNMPLCGFLGDDPACQRRSISPVLIAVAVIIPLIVFATVLFLLLTRIRLGQSSDPFWWRTFLSEISIDAKSTRSATGSAFHDKSDLKKSETTLPASEASNSQHKDLVLEGFYNGNPVELHPLDQPLHRATLALRPVFQLIRRLQHNNVLNFISIAVNDDQLCEFAVYGLAFKGSLMKLLRRTHFNLDWHFKASLIKDLVGGMTFLHGSGSAGSSHGNLNAYNCRIDSNFVLKISEFGLHPLRNEEDLVPISEYDPEDRNCELLLWRAPELLRRVMPSNGTQKGNLIPARYMARWIKDFASTGDVYSFAIILQQIILRSPPFRSTFPDNPHGDSNTLTDKELILEIKRGTNPPLRPRVPNSSCPPAIREVVENCWDENPNFRHSFTKTRDLLTKHFGKVGENIIEHLIDSMEKHAAGLELEADNKVRMLEDEKQRSDDIIAHMLPKSIAHALAHGQHPPPEVFESTTVQFSDVDGFSTLVSEARTPHEVIGVLNALYATCDFVIENYDVYKVETVKDAYMIVSGLPIRNGLRHADNIASLALHMRRNVSMMIPEETLKESSTKLKLRVGIHSGPCVAAIIGTRLPRYCLFGDTVNTSSRMESHGEPGRIQCSDSTKELLDIIGGFVLMERGNVEIKGKGPMKTYWIVAKE